MAAATKVGFFLFFFLVILAVFCAGTHAKGCPFKSLYKQYGNSIVSSSLGTIIGTIDGDQHQPSFVHGVNNTLIGETRPHTRGDFFAQHEWLKNHVNIMMQKNIGTAKNNDYNNKGFYSKFIEAVRMYFIGS
ncbi:hypothetical protein A4A49_51679 [Nicotiana attenuata]|uniref:Uncharacterized protein n=1 Tax=Nicotiana attenuata TaxID=49451 RepID=A0A314KT42_NICAT|nr:hypothetical protein A4A49_51679 [Nicotiana attenuata]